MAHFDSIVNTDIWRSADCRILPCRDDTAVFSYTYTHIRMYGYILLKL